MNTLLINLGNRIKKIRTEQNLTQAYLAAKCKSEKSSISKIEAGKVNVSFITLCKISEALNIPVQELFVC